SERADAEASSPKVGSADRAPVGTGVPVAEGLNLVVVIDLATLPIDALGRIRQAIASLTQEDSAQTTRLMLATIDHGVQLRQPFTRDHQQFLAAVDAVSPSTGDADAGLPELIDRVEQTCDGTPGSLQPAIALGRAWVESARLGMNTALEGVGAIAHYLSSLPGRKHVVFYSAGYAMDPA